MSSHRILFESLTNNFTKILSQAVCAILLLKTPPTTATKKQKKNSLVSLSFNMHSIKIDSMVYLRIVRDVKMRAVKAGLFLVKSLSVAQTAQCLTALTFPMVPIAWLKPN